MKIWTGALAAAALASTALAGPAAASPPAHHPTAGDGRTAHTATQRALDAAVAGGVPGVLAQARGRDGVWNGDAGVADLTTGRERGPDDRFRVGSVTKTFVATVLLQLEAEGRIGLDDTVDRWLPGVVSGNGNDGSAITVRQLLNHTSGIFNVTADPGFQRRIFGPEFLEHRYDTWTPDQLVAVALQHRPDFAPGTSWNYSNTNYLLAGMIIEKVTGRSYGTEIERRILRPLHLDATSVPGTVSRMPRPSGRAYSKLSFDPSAETIHDVTELNPSVAGPAGEMISDTADLNRFYSALLGGRLLPAAQLKEMKTTVVPEGAPEGSGYGLGLEEQKLPCGTVVWGHTGGIHGSTSEAVTTADGRHSLALNLNGDWTGSTGDAVEAEFCG